MPWNGGDGTPGIFPSLGHAVAEYIEENVIIPDGQRMGEPYILTDEQYMHLLHAYRLVPNARDGEGSDAFRYSGALLIRSQKWGKRSIRSSDHLRRSAWPRAVCRVGLRRRAGGTPVAHPVDPVRG